MDRRPDWELDTVKTLPVIQSRTLRNIVWIGLVLVLSVGFFGLLCYLGRHP